VDTKTTLNLGARGGGGEADGVLEEQKLEKVKSRLEPGKVAKLRLIDGTNTGHEAGIKND